MPRGRAKLHFDNLFEDDELPVGDFLLYQAGDLACEAGYTVDEHEQKVDEISYVVSGEGVFSVNGEDFTVRKGDIVLSSSGELHNICSSMTDPLRFFYVGFTLVSPEKEPYLELMAPFRVAGIKRVNSTVLFDCFIAFLEELSRPDRFSQLMIQSLLMQLVCMTSRVFQKADKNGYFLSDRLQADSRLVRDIAAYLDTHSMEMPHLRELSAKFGYSYTHIAQLFSSTMGESLKAYHTRRRFEKACDELKQGLSVTAVAELTGFQSVHAFSRAFKNQIGVTPKEYKQNNTREGACDK